MLIRFAFGVIVRFSFSMSTARSPEVSLKLLHGMSSSKVGSSIIVSNVRDMLVVVESVFEVCVELSPTAPGTVGIGAFGFKWDHHIISGEDVDRGHFDRPHAGDVANHRS